MVGGGPSTNTCAHDEAVYLDRPYERGKEREFLFSCGCGLTTGYHPRIADAWGEWCRILDEEEARR